MRQSRASCRMTSLAHRPVILSKAVAQSALFAGLLGPREGRIDMRTKITPGFLLALALALIGAA